MAGETVINFVGNLVADGGPIQTERKYQHG